MKTSLHQTVEPRPSICLLSNVSGSLPKTTSRIPGNTIVTDFKAQTPQQSVDHFQLVWQAEQYMMEHMDHTISVDMLCAALYVSRRTLHNAFQEVVGVGPMTYLKIQRMYQVHDQLERAHSLASTVFNIAYQWGFYHMGHFSRDYKQMFGESPSDTLKRAPKTQQE
jgi:AraC-like DNA-binding protein